MGKNEGGDQKKGDGGKKEDGPITVVLEFDMPCKCQGCTNKVESAAKEFKGVHTANADSSSNKLTVVCEVDPEKIRQWIESKFKKEVVLVSPLPKKDKEGGGGGGEKKADEKQKEKKADCKKPKGGGGGGEKKADEKKEKKADEKEKKADDKKPKGGGGGGEKKERKGENAVEKPKKAPSKIELRCSEGYVHKTEFSCEGCKGCIHKIELSCKGRVHKIELRC